MGRQKGRDERHDAAGLVHVGFLTAVLVADKGDQYGEQATFCAIALTLR
jgi:hypothetical protein